MAYVWAALAAIEPAFRTATDASDPVVRELMKLPASVADIGLAMLVAYALRGRPRLGGRRRRGDPAPPRGDRRQRLVGPVRVHLPAVRPCCGAPRDQRPERLGGRRDRGRADDQAAGAAAAGAVRCLVLGDRRMAGARACRRRPARSRPSCCGSRSSRPAAPRTTSATWAQYQGGIFNILSLRAWNLWWLVQEAAAGGGARRGRRGHRGTPDASRRGLPGGGGARGLDRGRDRPRPAATNPGPGPGRVRPGRLLVRDADARALRLRSARLPGPAGRRARARAGSASPLASSSR